MQQVFTRGAAYEARQRQQSQYPSPHQDVLQALARGPMRAGRLAAALSVGVSRVEQTCEELVAAGRIKRDTEAFYELTETN